MRSPSIFLLLFLAAITSQSQSLPFNPLFDESKVNSIFITMNTDSLLELYTDVESNHEYNVQFIYDDGVQRDTLENTGFRLRGNSSRYSAKKSFKISFNTYDPGRKYENHEKINLNGSHNDPSMVREKLYYDAWNKFDLPARRSSFVRLYINNDYYGLYTNIEEMDEIWCKERFGDNSGNLYKCTYPSDLTYEGADQDDYKSIESSAVTGGRAYDLQNNPSADDYTDLVNFITILNQTPLADLPCELEKVFDVEAFLRAYCMDVASGNWDDYAFNKNNYYLYHNPFTDQMEFIAYDCDNTFGVDWIGIDWTARSIYEWENAAERPLVTRLLDVPEYKDRYSYYLNLLVNTVLNPVTIGPHIDSMKNLITDAALEDEFKVFDYGYTDEDFLNSFNTNDIDGHTPYGVKNFITAFKSNAQTQLVLNNIAPVLREEHHLPQLPEVGEDIFVMVTSFDDVAMSNVKIYSSFDSLTFTQATLYDDGLHNDGEADDAIFGVQLPPATANGYLYYHFQATDNNSLVSRFPVCGDFSMKIGFEPPAIFINEFLAANNTVIGDNAGEFDDYVELYNAGTESVYLGNKYISDDLQNPSKWRLPAVTLDGDHYILLWTDNDPEQGAYHADFSLNADGEQIGLFASAEEYFAAIDTYSFGLQTADISVGRLPNGTGPFGILPGPTPGFNNYSVGIADSNTDHNSLLLLSNPSSGTTVAQLFLTVPSPLTTLQLCSMQGVTIRELSFSSLHEGTHTFSINTTALPSGLYFVKVTFNGTMLVEKLAVQ
ncbi:MAG: CotH kinase family protein [Chitinophagaceae bacterium]|nr:CotH kinase family protein [Chitinophagaceae bacterium]